MDMQTKKDCLLIVDDDFINREVLKNIFADEWRFAEAENGAEGLRIVQERGEELCAILLDFNMPVMNGMELLFELDKQNVPSKIPVFLITANDELAVAREAYELGVMDVISKPVTPFIVKRRVESVVELYKAREELSDTVRGQERQLQENADTIDSLHRNTIEVLASAIEFRDMESGEHTNRIYGITKYILSHTAMGEGFSAEEIECMAIGSIMHDIGKIAISDVILNKPGRLTREEFEAMKQHTVKGGRLMEQLFASQSHDAYKYACDIARHHHERYDGRGYPDGLKGDEITVWSQVVSIADVYDALVSPRVYKKAFSHDRAVEMICGGECGVFNPKLIECFLQVEPQIRKWYEIKGEELATPEESRRKSMTEALADFGQPSKELVDVLLLTAAVKSAYDMIICVNLTRNSYYMIDYDRFLSHCAKEDGEFDQLITFGASTIPPSHRQLFIDAFCRDSLLTAYAQGKKSVHLQHPQYADDGRLMSVETTVLFMEDPRNGDLMEITLSRYTDRAEKKN